MKLDVLTMFTVKPNERWILDFVLLSSLCYARLSVDVVEKTSEGWNLVYRCSASGANFGRDVPMSKYYETGCISLTEPKDACEKVQRPSLNISCCKDVYAVAPRGICRFSEKAYNVQLGEYSAAIVFSRTGEQPLWMQGSAYAERIQVPVVMVDYECMEKIIEFNTPENGIRIAMYATSEFGSFTSYVPFILVIGLWIIIVLFSTLLHRFDSIGKNYLTKRKIEKLPTKKFEIGLNSDTCVICLEDFVEGEVLRLLPCKHVHHRKCIDLWLKANKEGLCPICKREVYTPRAAGNAKPVVEQQRADTNENVLSDNSRDSAFHAGLFLGTWERLLHLRGRNRLLAVGDVENGQAMSRSVSREPIVMELSNSRTNPCCAEIS